MNNTQMQLSDNVTELESKDDLHNEEDEGKCLSVNCFLAEVPNLSKLDEKKQDIPFNNKVFEDSVNYTFSVEKIIHLATQLENPSISLKAFFSKSPETVAKVFEDVVNTNEISKLNDFNNEETWLEWLDDQQLYGWLIQVTIPKILFYLDDKVFCYTWDYPDYKWFYAETYEMAISKAKEWIIGETNKKSNSCHLYSK
ncbi:hypothetical protein [Snodgrassella alvi]|uniref:hypothetical protein n=1 Tax=Snodgrassella alvi TaxID=1196083 RepID=UPI003516F6D6